MSQKYESAVTVEPQAGQRDKMRDNDPNWCRQCTDACEGGGQDEGNNGGDIPGGGSGIRSRAGGTRVDNGFKIHPSPSSKPYWVASSGCRKVPITMNFGDGLK
jgi:hypothetical protein